MTAEQLMESLRNGSGREQMAAIVLESGFGKALNESVKTALTGGIPPDEQIQGIVAAFVAWMIASMEKAPPAVALVFALQLQEKFDAELENAVTNLLLQKAPK